MPDLEDVFDDEEHQAEEAKKNTSGTLYFMQETDHLTGEKFDYIKIGIVRGDKEVNGREKAHRTGNPRNITTVKELQMPDVQRLETHLHNQFAVHRVSSGEWFYLPGDLFAKVFEVALARQAELVANSDKLEAEAVATKTEHSGKPMAGNSELESLVKKILELKARESKNKKEKDLVSKALVEIAGESKDYQHLFKVSSADAKKEFDSGSFRESHPEIYELFKTKVSSNWKLKYLIKAESLESPERIIEGLSPIELHQSYLDLWSRAAELTWELTLFEADLLHQMGDSSEIEGLVTWSLTTSMLFEKAAFIKEHEDLHIKFQRDVPAKITRLPAEWASYPR
jgi:hypothetical protein